VKNQNRAEPPSVIAMDDGSVDLQPALLEAGQLHFIIEHAAFIAEPFEQIRNLVPAQRFEGRFAAQTGVRPKKSVKGAVGDANATLFVEQQNTLDHAVEKRFLLGERTLNGGAGKLLKAFAFSARLLVGAGEFIAPPEMNSDSGGSSDNG
jgi:hypothetical protein